MTIALTIPFWIVGFAVKSPPGVPLNLPISALDFVCPLIAALILVRRNEGPGTMRALLSRVLDPRGIRPGIWYLVIGLFMPISLLISAIIVRLLGEPAGSSTPVWAIPLLFSGFFVPALCEEVGWTGYLVDSLQGRHSALATGVIVGIAWVTIHLGPWLQVNGLSWTVGYSLFTIAVRVVMVWLYNNTAKSLLAVILFHDMINTAASISPFNASPLHPYVLGAVLTVAILVIAFLWGSSTLAQFRFAPARVLKR